LTIFFAEQIYPTKVIFTLAKIAALSSGNTPAVESITPTNFSNAQRDERKVKATKMLFCFINICAQILLNILGYSFCAVHHILVQHCQMLLPQKASKMICAKAPLLLRQKCW
jgi:hypothetical protein